MSDLLIKCMKIPETCKLCPLSEFDARNYVIACKASGYLIDYQLAKTTRPPMICPLVEVPPHGRLVDADEMYEEFVLEGQRSTRYKLGEVWELNGKEIRRAIYRLPTVIPATEAKEGE